LYSISKKKIRQHFAECGDIASFEMPLTKQGESKGIAFIVYKTEDGLNNALALNDTQLGSRNLTVQRKAPKKDKQQDSKQEMVVEGGPAPKRLISESLDPRAAALFALETASGEEELRAALDHAKGLGFSKKDVPFKRAKERLYGDTPVEFNEVGKPLVGILARSEPLQSLAKQAPLDPRAAALAAIGVG